MRRQRARVQEQTSHPEIVYISEKRPDGYRRRRLLVGAVASIGIAVIVIVAMLLSVIPETGWLIAGGVAAGFCVPGAIAGYRWWLAARYDKELQEGVKRKQEAELRQSEAQADEAEGKARQAHATADNLEIDRHFHSTDAGTAIVGLKPGVPIRILPKRTASERALLALPEPEELPKLLPLLREHPCWLISGGRNSGKTQVFLHLIDSKNGIRIICDPKGIALNPWPPGVKVAEGPGAIMTIIKHVHNVLEDRRGRKVTTAKPIYLGIDELFYIVSPPPAGLGLPIMDYVFVIVTLGREYGVHCSFTCSDEGVKALGIEGRSGLKRGLTRLEIDHNPIDHQRRGYLLHKPGEKYEVELPGLFVGGGGATRIISRTKPAPAPAKTPEQIRAEKEAEFCRLVLKEGLERKVACPRVFDAPYTGKRAQRLKKALEASDFH